MAIPQGLGATVLAKRLKGRKLPTVDVPNVSEPELNRTLEGIKEHLRMYEGDSNAPKERFVTIAELENAGLITAKTKNKFAFIAEVQGVAVSQPAGSTNPAVINQTVIQGGGGGGVDTLFDLTDTAIDGASAGEFLQFSGGSWRNFNLFGSDSVITGRWKHTDDIDFAFGATLNWEDLDANPIEFLGFAGRVTTYPGGGFALLPNISDITYTSVSPILNVSEYQTIMFHPDGMTAYIGRLDPRTLSAFALSTPYDITTINPVPFAISALLSVGSQRYQKHFQWSADGLTLHYTDWIQGLMLSQDISTPYDITELTGTATRSFAVGGSLTGFDFTDDGTYLVTTRGGPVTQMWSLSTPFDITTAVTFGTAFTSPTQLNSPEGVVLSDDGFRIILMSTAQTGGEGIFQFTLGTAFDCGTMAYDTGETLQFNSTEPFPTDITWVPGERAFFIGWYASPGQADCIIERYDYTGGFFSGIAVPGVLSFTVGDPAWPTIIEGSTLTLGNYNFDIDQTLAAAQDNYVLTYDSFTRLISLESNRPSTLYYNNTEPRLSARATNAVRLTGSDNVTSSRRSLGWELLDGSLRGEIYNDANSAFIMHNWVNSQDVRLVGTTSAGAQRTLINCQPNSTIQLYHLGVNVASTSATGMTATYWTCPQNTGPTTGLNNSGYYWVRANFDTTIAMFTNESAGPNKYTLQNTISEFSYQFSTTLTAADPGFGSFRLNGASYGAVTEMYVSNRDFAPCFNGTDAPNDWVWNTTQVGDLVTIRSAYDSRRWIQALVTSITDNGVWHTVGLNILTSGTLFMLTLNDVRFHVQHLSRAPVPANITIADEAADTTSFPLFATAATGNLGPKTNAGLTFDASTEDLNSTLIAGIANADLVDKAAAETITGDWSFTGGLVAPAEVVTATNVITATEGGKTFYLDAAGGFTSTLPAPALGLKFTFIVKTAPTTAYIITTDAGSDLLYGTFLNTKVIATLTDNTGGTANDTVEDLADGTVYATDHAAIENNFADLAAKVNELINAPAGGLTYFAAQDTLNFVANTSVIGDRLEVESDGTNWYCKACSGADGGITVAVT